jgi:hypothetical protein
MSPESLERVLQT